MARYNLDSEESTVTMDANERLRSLWLLCVGILATSLSLVILVRTGNTFRMDDAFIYSDYIRNAIGHQGLVFNAGEHVNALTSPIYSYILLGVCSITGKISQGEAVLFVVFFASSLAVSIYQLNFLVGPRAAVLGGSLLASAPFFYILIGMESSLFLLLLTASVALFAQGRYSLLAIVLALCVLTRFEAGLLLPIMLLEHRRLRRPLPGWRVLIGPAVVFMVTITLNWIYYHSLLPHTASAKIGQGLSGYWGHWPFAFLHAKNQLKIWANFYIYLAIASAAGFYGLRIVWSTIWSRVVFRFLLGLLAFYILFNIPAYPWYYAPFFFFLMLYAAIGLASLLQGYPKVVTAVLALAFSLYGISYGTQTIALLETPEMGNAFLAYRDIGEWLQDHTAQSATIEAAEIGVLGWYAHRRIIDILGLTQPDNALFIAHREPAKWLSIDQPDYIVIHEKPYIYEAVAAHDPRYVAVDNFKINGYLVLRRIDVHPN